MAGTEYFQDLAFQQLSQAIMATANSMASAGGSGSDGGDSLFDVMRRKLSKVQDVIQGMAAPLKRRSLLFEEVPEHIMPPVTPEVIEMSHLMQRGEGHTFVPCQLSNPTWCDYCGDFIWGLYKQCMRCQTCQYTCHQHCVPAVNLNCKSIQDDGAAVVSTVTPTSSKPVPGHHIPQASPQASAFQPRGRLEPSRSLGQLSARPGSATRLLPGEASVPALSSGVSSQLQYHPLQQDGGGTAQAQALTAVKHHHKHLSRSASDGFVTVPPSILEGKSSSGTPPPQHVSPSRHQPQHILSPSSPSSSTPQSASPRRRQSEPSSSPVPRRPDTPPPPPGAVPQHHLEHVPSPPREGASGVRDGETATDAATEKDETDSGYRSGTIPDEKLPKVPSQATLDRQELKRKITKYNHFVPAASFEITEKEAFQGFVKVTMNLIRPITMELGARPPSIYELLTREHIVEENTQHVAFYMPRDTHKSLHISSDTTTKEVITSLLKKFHILDHPRKFAMYDQEFNDKNKLVRLRRLHDKDFPLRAILDWDPERIRNYRLVLQENETGEIVWDAFSLPELSNFMRVLDREEKETILELRHKYAYMRQYMERRLAELRGERRKSKA